MRTDIDRIVQNRPIRPFKSIRSMDVVSPSPSPSPSPSLDVGDEWSDFVKDLESMPGTRMRPTKGRYIGWRAQRIEERLMRADAAELADAVAALCSMRVPRPPSLRSLPAARRAGPVRAWGWGWVGHRSMSSRITMVITITITVVGLRVSPTRAVGMGYSPMDWRVRGAFRCSNRTSWGICVGVDVCGRGTMMTMWTEPRFGIR